MWEDICLSPIKWVRHSCKTPGCREGYVTADGNEQGKASADVETIDVPPEFQSTSKEANIQPEKPRNSRGCKKTEKIYISLFYETAAGMLALLSSILLKCLAVNHSLTKYSCSYWKRLVTTLVTLKELRL